MQHTSFSFLTLSLKVLLNIWPAMPLPYSLLSELSKQLSKIRFHMRERPIWALDRPLASTESETWTGGRCHSWTLGWYLAPPTWSISRNNVLCEVLKEDCTQQSYQHHIKSYNAMHHWATSSKEKVHAYCHLFCLHGIFIMKQDKEACLWKIS